MRGCRHGGRWALAWSLLGPGWLMAWSVTWASTTHRTQPTMWVVVAPWWAGMQCAVGGQLQTTQHRELERAGCLQMQLVAPCWITCRSHCSVSCLPSGGVPAQAPPLTPAF
jgi:hypothetical protein